MLIFVDKVISFHASIELRSCAFCKTTKFNEYIDKQDFKNSITIKLPR